ncbi:hypothetical protein PV646_32075 [Streptomyces sp. ID05-26A]|nr:hypothetical protein [Streptomyces sp. ID05-26A]
MGDLGDDDVRAVGADLAAFLPTMAGAKRDMSDAIVVPSEPRDSLHATLDGPLERAHRPHLPEIVLNGLQSSRKP